MIDLKLLGRTDHTIQHADYALTTLMSAKSNLCEFFVLGDLWFFVHKVSPVE